MSLQRTEFIERVKASTQILDVVGEYVVLRRQGKNHTGLCPFHSERTPSFSVSEQKQLFYCYGCKAGGDVITFVKDIQAISWNEAVEDLADRANIPLPSDWKRSTPASNRGNSAETGGTNLLYKINRFVSIYFRNQFVQTERARTYVESRGVSEEQQKNFYVGYAREQWRSLYDFLVSKKAPISEVLQLGLVKRTQSQAASSEYVDLFRDRIIFPIVNTRGKVCGFGGRSLLSEQTPKYLNSAESPIFQKGKILYGFFQSSKYIREADAAIVVEGYFDALALHDAGFKNTVATCGTALTQDHLKILRRITSKIILLYDGDEAGQSATLKAMEMGLTEGVILYSVKLPPSTDPDEFLREPGGRESLGQMIAHARPILDSCIEEALSQAYTNPEEEVRALKKIADWLNHLQDPLAVELRLKNLEIQIGLSKTNLIKQHIGPRRSGPPSTSQFRGQPTRARPIPPSEKVLFSLWIQVEERIRESDASDENLTANKYKESLLALESKLPPGMTIYDIFTDKNLKDFLISYETEKTSTGDPLGQILSKPWESQIISLATSAAVKGAEFIEREHFLRVSTQLIQGAWARFSQKIKFELMKAESGQTASDEQERLMKEYLDVQRKMKEFKDFHDEIQE